MPVFLLFPIAAFAEGTERFCSGQFLNLFEDEGAPPEDFIIEKLKDKDIILFDDALHNLAEPWDFYIDLLENEEFRDLIDIIFLEIIPLNKQPALDAYFQTTPENKELLYPAFHDRAGWNYKTYFDLLAAIYEANKSRPEDNKIKVVAVSNPTYWSEIFTREDVRIYNESSAAGRDNLMFELILEEMNHFKDGEKAIFLTNTRHSYKGLKDNAGNFIWNTGTFFSQWQAGKTYSIRFHAPYLEVLKKKMLYPDQIVSAEGLEEFEISWSRPAKGALDDALENFKAPVALEISGNAIGRLPYLGNLMLIAAPGQTMKDAYDAMIFLKPIDDLEATADIDFIYTDEFKVEVARRLPLLFSDEQITGMMEGLGVKNLSDLTEAILVSKDRGPLPQATIVGPRDEWQEGCEAE